MQGLILECNYLKANIALAEAITCLAAYLDRVKLTNVTLNPNMLLILPSYFTILFSFSFLRQTYIPK